MKTTREYFAFNLRGDEASYAPLFEYLESLGAKRLALHLWEIDTAISPYNEEEFSEKLSEILSAIPHNALGIQDSLVVVHPYPDGVREQGFMAAHILKFVVGPEA